jgi:excisionase family DNA binding protein
MAVETRERLLLTISACSRLLSVSRSHLYSQISCGRFGPELIRLGRKVLVDRLELERWIAAKCPCRGKWLQLQEAAR